MKPSRAILWGLNQRLIAYPEPPTAPKRSTGPGRPPKTPANIYSEALAYVDSHPGCTMKQAAELFGISYDMLRKCRQKVREKTERC